jgi:hypothetical protein
MKVRVNTMTPPRVRAEMVSPRACLAFAALEAIGKIGAWLRKFCKSWSERRNLGVDGGRVVRTRAQQRGLGDARSRSQ